MKTISKTLLLGLAAVGLGLTSCETVENRISEHQDMFNTLSPRDQALVLLNDAMTVYGAAS